MFIRSVVCVLGLSLILFANVNAKSAKIKRQVGSNCGKKKIATQGLIVNGFSTKPGEWPWHVAIFHVSRGNRAYACGGTLVNEYQVVTAGHCVVDSNTGNALLPAILVLQLGAYDLSVSSGNSEEHKAHQINLHEGYVHSLHRNDIAIVTLESKVKFSLYIQPVCLFNGDAESLAKTKVSGVAVGWGITETDETSDTLRAASMPLIGFFDCLESNRQVFGRTLTKDNICAGYRNGTTVCNGDSGGGLFINMGGAWYLVGIVSFSSLRDFGKPYCSQNDYGVFVSVGNFANWMEKFLLNSPNRFDTGSTIGGLRISQKKCREYESRGIAATSKQRSYVTKAQLYKNANYVSDGHIISENFVISPANENYGDRPNKVRKTKGSLKVELNIAGIIFHPDYVHGLLDNDIALIKFESSIETKFNAWTKVACLYTQLSFSDASILSDFKDPVVRISSNNVCESKLKATRKFRIDDIDSEICTNVCLSREIVIKVPNTDSTHLAAIPSLCEDDGDGEGVYNKLASSIDWIEQTVW